MGKRGNDQCQILEYRTPLATIQKLPQKKNATQLGGIFFTLNDRQFAVCLSLLKS